MYQIINARAEDMCRVTSHRAAASLYSTILKTRTRARALFTRPRRHRNGPPVARAAWHFGAAGPRGLFGPRGWVSLVRGTARRRGSCLAVGQHGRLHDLARDDVRVHVGGGPAVLKVALLLLLRHARDADRAAPVRDAPRELLVRGGLVRARQAALVVEATRGVVRRDVLLLLAGRAEPLHRLEDRVISALGAHRLGRHVGVAAGAVPVARDGLRVEGDDHAVLLAHADQQVARGQQLVARGDAGARPDLVLPLSGHHLAVDAGDVDAGVEARLVVRLDHCATKGVLGADGAVVRALRARLAVLWPAVRRLLVGLEEGVLLLDAEPRLVARNLVHDLVGVHARVGRDRRAEAARPVRVGLVAVAEHEDVRAPRAERVLVDGARLEQHLRVLARRLLGRRAVKVPDREVIDGLGGGVERLGLAAQLALAAHPDVLGHHLAALVELGEAILDRQVALGVGGEHGEGHDALRSTRTAV